MLISLMSSASFLMDVVDHPRLNNAIEVRQPLLLIQEGLDQEELTSQPYPTLQLES